MSLLTSAPLLSGTAVAASGDGFTPPGPADFWLPMWGEGWLLFTRPMGVALIITVILMGVLWMMTRNASAVPTKGQFVFEYIYDFVRNGIGQDIIGSKEFRRFVPLLLSLFLFIWFTNLAGVITPFMMPVSARIGFPLALVLVAFLTYHYVGVRKHGPVGYIKNMVPAGLPGWITPAILLLELITNFITRPLTLTLRLFGTMFAGHMLLALFVLGGEYMISTGQIFLVLSGVGSLLMGVLVVLFEILIQSLQAYIFALLTASYIGDALADSH
ncbi:MAG: F0F1 ATP synthase subunit A [Mobilicoccus sp.]|nr:F0F1 ATP synthase subunit A [Mobilicoccus sp.]